MMLFVNVFLITLVSGMAFATFPTHNPQITMERVMRQVPNYGTLINEDNRNSNIRAQSSCYGRIVGSRNSDYQCENSSVEILSNRNTKVSVASSTLTVKSNANSDIEAEDAWAKFEDNSNLKFKGNGGFNKFLSRFVGNRNSKFEGSNNEIVATDNRNLSVEGNDNQLDISHIRNHAVRPAASSRNTATFSRPYGHTNVHFDIEYVQSARISRSNYQLGNYNFDVAESDDMVRVSLQKGSVQDSTSNKIDIQGQGNQSLELIGQRVEILSPKSFNIYCY